MSACFSVFSYYCFIVGLIIKIQNWKLSCLRCLRAIKISWRNSIEPVLACFRKVQHDFFSYYKFEKSLSQKDIRKWSWLIMGSSGNALQYELIKNRTAWQFLKQSSLTNLWKMLPHYEIPPRKMVSSQLCFKITTMHAFP